MTALNAIVLAAFAARALERLFFHTYTWQLKEYRWDRYRAHLFSRQGLWILFHPWYWTGIALVVIYLFSEQLFGAFPASLRGTLIYGYGSIVWILFSVIAVAYRLFQHRLQRPDKTARAFLVIFGTAAIMTAFFFIPDVYWFTLLFPTLLLIPVIVSLMVWATSFPAAGVKRKTIARAKEKIASMPNLTVIGITGSYGKSSAKEFLATILASKFKVCKSPKNVNSEIGIAKTVLNDLTTDHQIFIAEMGAYRQGEIQAVCDIVHPRIGILTAISEQHMALFGSLGTIQETKYELINALPENGTAIFNGDNRITRECAERTLKPTVVYSIERPADITASAIVVQPEKLSCSVQIGNEKHHISVPLLGGFHVSNLLAAIAAAHTLGMTLSEIAEALKSCAAPEHTMQPFHHPSGALIIDDSYSANPDGVIGALRHLKTIPRTYKVLVMMPMIELGSAGKEAHRRVGEVIGHTCDAVILTQKNYASILQKASGFPDQKFHVLSTPRQIIDALSPYLNANSVIVLENRIPAAVLRHLQS